MKRASSRERHAVPQGHPNPKLGFPRSIAWMGAATLAVGLVGVIGAFLHLGPYQKETLRNLEVMYNITIEDHHMPLHQYGPWKIDQHDAICRTEGAGDSLRLLCAEPVAVDDFTKPYR